MFRVSAGNVANGPTLHLVYGQGEVEGCSVAEFMYFVPLISPEPVSFSKTAGNTQRAKILSVTRRDSGEIFLVTCDVEFSGQGAQHNVFDLNREIHRHERGLKSGKTLEHQLSSINVEGAGRLKIEVEGTKSEQMPTVNEVRLHFNAHGKDSPVSIGLCDIKYLEGKFERCNEMVARVNTLTFRRKPNPPKMEVTVASVKRADAGDNLWQNFVGSVKGKAVNLLIQPLIVESLGRDAMLDFGLALSDKAPTFTFPKAKNLKVEQ
ncbi:MAG TPA: hypothetical protein VFB72_14575 [Verrucomicrobiae bacterium]|nr:hypothetical protein [Verrucomicrobiae bacterium]